MAASPRESHQLDDLSRANKDGGLNCLNFGVVELETRCAQKKSLAGTWPAVELWNAPQGRFWC
jgi:hypothetical protein